MWAEIVPLNIILLNISCFPPQLPGSISLGGLSDSGFPLVTILLLVAAAVLGVVVLAGVLLKVWLN